MAELPEGFVLEDGGLPAGFQLEETPKGLKGGIIYGAQGAMRGLTGVLDVPGQLMNLVTGRQDQTLGQTIRQGIGAAQEQAGVATGRSAPGTTYQYENIEQIPPEFRASARAGEAIGATYPFMAIPIVAARSVSIPAAIAAESSAPTALGVGPAASNAVKQMVASAASNPSYFVASQIPSTLGAAAGAYGAEAAFPGSELAQMAGQFSGGLLGAGLTAGAMGGAGTARGQIAGAIPGTEEAARMRAGRELAPILRQAQEAPEQIIQRLQTPDIVPGALPAELAQSRAVTGVQRLLASQDPELANALAASRERVAGNIQAGVQQGFQPGQMQALTEAAATRQRGFEQRLDNLVSAAETRAQATVTKSQAEGAQKLAAAQVAATERAGVAAEAAGPIAPLTPGQARGLNVQARNILEDALSKARAEERQLWGQVPKNEPIMPTRTLAAYDDLRAGMIPEEKMPSVIDRVMTRYRDTIDEGKPVTSGELLSVRSTLLEEARDFRAQNNFKDARRAKEMADAILGDLETIGGNAAANARDFSRALNDRFSRSFAGDVLGTKPSGAERVRPELTLEAATSGQPERVAAQLGELRAAVAEQGPAMQAIQQDFLRTLTERIIDPTTGAVIPRRADAFLRDNAAILEQFPQVRASIRQAAEAQRASETAGKAVPQIEREVAVATTQVQRESETAVKEVLKRTGDAAKEAERTAAFARVLRAGENPQNAVASAVQSANPVRELTKLSTLALRDGREAVGGLRAAVMRWATDDATRASGLSYGKLNQTLMDPISDRGMSVLQTLERNKILSGEQRGQIEALIKRGVERELADTTGMEVKEFGKLAGMAGRYIPRIIGAKMSTFFSGGGAGESLQLAQMGANVAERVASRLPADKVNAVMAQALKADTPDELIQILEYAARYTPSGRGQIDPATRELIVALRAMIVQPGYQPERPPGGARAFRPEMLGTR